MAEIDKKSKDGWDKADVLAKFAIPIAVALSVLFWNQQRTVANTSSAMIEIAVGILSDQPSGSENDPLRDWAVSVLKRPNDPPALSKAAAEALESEPLVLSPAQFFCATLPSGERCRELTSLGKSLSMLVAEGIDLSTVKIEGNQISAKLSEAVLDE